jgi:Histidine kinase-like ATPase domain
MMMHPTGMVTAVAARTGVVPVTQAHVAQFCGRDEDLARIVGGCLADALRGGLETARAFPAAREACRAARRFVSETLRRWGAADGAGDAEIVVTELATNAVVHARSAFQVELAVTGSSVLIRVSDTVPLHGPSGGAPLVAAPTHGLGVIAAIARAWGAEPVTGGKAVWADLPRGERQGPR